MSHRSGQPKAAAAQPQPKMLDPGIRITTTNENWRGKNDPAERRRIQNRLNQRAFRERQRAGDTTKQYNPRGSTTTSASPEKKPECEDDDDDEEEDDDEEAEDDDDDGEEKEESEDDGEDEESSSSEDSDDSDSDDEEAEAQQSNPGSPPLTIPARPHFTGQVPRAACTPATSTPSADNPWDELAQLINRNFMQAATTNANHLGLNLASLHSATAASTPRPRNAATLPPTLKPIEVQHQLPHDLIIDTIPHARLRFNILRAIATGNLDASRFSACLRQSGAVVNVQGEARRSGLIVWNFPEHLSSWELSEAFVMTWGFLLEGCEDFVAVTNVWRSRRGERSLVVGSKSGSR